MSVLLCLQVRVPMTTILPRAKRAAHDDPADSRQPAAGTAQPGRDGPLSRGTSSASAGLGAGSSAAPTEQSQDATQGRRAASAAEEESDEDTDAVAEVQMLCRSQMPIHTNIHMS